jgi:hypothetical protein
MVKESSPLLIGLHGSLAPQPARGVHDAAYCLADLQGKSVKALVESEKITGVRHDGRLDSHRLSMELAAFTGMPQEFIGSHFTAFTPDSSREFPCLGR